MPEASEDAHRREIIMGANRSALKCTIHSRRIRARTPINMCKRASTINNIVRGEGVVAEDRTTIGEVVGTRTDEHEM